ncbi:uncharacterized protein PGRI_095540 [Penicillium griseofulvum]|uniref:Protein kinase domain-containing protein n=1 Tax=Penicillium patulum TaxID=5078 RepID=A0A135LQQ4_PENPA|nr:uncharacterized protein PGRI_095540 [Penicillium griseofulvum]KXG51293.1 hypothetical protein PGRI_095540 [Penicillium griseofulvum]
MWYPLDIIIGSIFKALRGRTQQASDSEATSSPTSAIDVRNEHTDTMSHAEIIEVPRYYPPGVSEIIGRGGECFVGAIDEFTVLKYPCIPGDCESIQIEAQLLKVLGSHPRIIAFKGLTENGLVLQRASNGSLNDYIASQSFIPLDRRLLWCKQAAEAISYIHEKRVIHCDINLRNLLLDSNLDILLADFQGMLKSVDGNTILDGLSRECSKSYQPRIHGDYACVTTDLFALGSAIYFIMTGHEVFPELDSLEDDEEILSRFQKGLFPNGNHHCSQITEKCWKQQYRQAAEVVSDLSLIQVT